MSKLHVYIDGTWFFKVVTGDVLKRYVSDPYKRYFKIDFNKLNRLMLDHISQFRPECTELGNLYFVTSLFTLPEDFDSWENRCIVNPYGGQSITITSENITITRNSINERSKFAESAIKAGYDPQCVFKIELREWMLLNLIHPELRYQEKQVDTTVVALLVRDTIEYKNDCFALVAGDADILPAIQVAYPSYTHNVFPVLTSPDELECKNRQTSFKYAQYNFEINTLVLQNHVGKIMAGNVYQCAQCHSYFTTLTPIEASKLASGAKQPYCKVCKPWK